MTQPEQHSRMQLRCSSPMLDLEKTIDRCCLQASLKDNAVMMQPLELQGERTCSSLNWLWMRGRTSSACAQRSRKGSSSSSSRSLSSLYQLSIGIPLRSWNPKACSVRGYQGLSGAATDCCEH